MAAISNSLAESKTKSKRWANYDPNPEPRPEDSAKPWANYIPATESLPEKGTATLPLPEPPEKPVAKVIPPKPVGK